MSECCEGPAIRDETPRICKNCEFGTCDYNTSQHYCLRVNGLRMIFCGPRRVAPTDTCKHFALHKRFKDLSR